MPETHSFDEELGLEADQRIANGGYKLVKRLGRGGFGTVWQATETQLKRDVALKFFGGASGARDQFDSVVMEEGPRLAGVVAKGTEGWQHIVIVYRSVPSDGNLPPFLELELMEGGSLRSRMRAGPWTEEEVLRLATQMGRALICAHRHGIAHCDIKPDNILMDESGKWFKLGDFGLSFRIAQGRDQAGGTPRYMSPEQFDKSKTVGFPTDIYSLGCVLYECIEGRPPFIVDEESAREKRWDAYRRQHVSDKPREPQSNACTDELKKLIMQCLQKEPTLRPTAQNLVNSLLNLRHSSEQTTSGRPKTETLTWDSQSQLILGQDDLPFRKEPGARGMWFPEEPVTHQNYYRFVTDQLNTRWSPQAIPLEAHDGGYLPDWFLGQPKFNEGHLPLNSVPYEAAEAFCRWIGGELPEYSVLVRYFKRAEAAPDEHPWLRNMIDWMKRTELPFLQLWCRDDRSHNSADMRVMYRWLMPTGKPGTDQLRERLDRVYRPRTYCFRYYTFMPVIPDEYTIQAIQSARRQSGGVNGESADGDDTTQARSTVRATEPPFPR